MLKPSNSSMFVSNPGIVHTHGADEHCPTPSVYVKLTVQLTHAINQEEAAKKMGYIGLVLKIAGSQVNQPPANFLPCSYCSG
jgi:hypothetical protein